MIKIALIYRLKKSNAIKLQYRSIEDKFNDIEFIHLMIKTPEEIIENNQILEDCDIIINYKQHQLLSSLSEWSNKVIHSDSDGNIINLVKKIETAGVKNMLVSNDQLRDFINESSDKIKAVTHNDVCDYFSDDSNKKTPNKTLDIVWFGASAIQFKLGLYTLDNIEKSLFRKLKENIKEDTIYDDFTITFISPISSDGDKKIIAKFYEIYGERFTHIEWKPELDSEFSKIIKSKDIFILPVFTNMYNTYKSPNRLVIPLYNGLNVFVHKPTLIKSYSEFNDVIGHSENLGEIYEKFIEYVNDRELMDKHIKGASDKLTRFTKDNVAKEFLTNINNILKEL